MGRRQSRSPRRTATTRRRSGSPCRVIDGLTFLKSTSTYRNFVILSVDGIPTAFYKSTGTGTPGLVKEGTWVPFGGIDPITGWFIKMRGKKPVGQFKRCSDWIKKVSERDHLAFSGSSFALSDYKTRQKWGIAVNDYLGQYGAAYYQHPGRFEMTSAEEELIEKVFGPPTRRRA